MTTTKLDIPAGPRICKQKRCIYMIEGEGACLWPRGNRGNGDALCHRVLPSEVLTWLTEIPVANGKQGDL